MERFDHVVVGGGAMGAATAWQLLRRGHSVALIEQFDIAHDQGSSHGAVRIFRFAYRNPLYAALAIEALGQLGETQPSLHVIVGREGTVEGWGAKDTVLVARRPFRQADIERALSFYRDVLGFEVTQRWQGAAFMSAGGYHHHIAINTWESEGASPPPRGSTGLSLIDPTTGKSTAIEIPKGATVSSPAWSPDGKQLAYIANFDAASHVYVADVATAKSVQVTKTPLLATLVTTMCSRPSGFTASATRRGSSASNQVGRPVLIAQKPQARVHTSPRIMIVAVRWSQHSPMFGQRASSHTV